MSDSEVNAVSSVRCQDLLKKSCGSCWAFGGAEDVTVELNQLMILEKTVHASPHKEEAWEDFYYDELYSGKGFFDDVTGKELNYRMTVEARKLEMAFFRKMNVYIKVPRSEAHVRGCKVISTKWLDINKGDDVHPNIRSRLVGRELKLDNRLDLFAATPQLESLRIIC